MDDEEPHHDYGCPSGGPVVFKIVNVLGQDDSDDEMRKCHAESTDSQDGLATELVDV